MSDVAKTLLKIAQEAKCKIVEQRTEINRLWSIIRNQSDKSNRFRVLTARAHRAEAKIKSLKEETVALSDYEKLEAELAEVRKDLKLSGESFAGAVNQVLSLKSKLLQYDLGPPTMPGILERATADLQARCEERCSIECGHIRSENKDLKAEIYDLRAKLGEYETH